MEETSCCAASAAKKIQKIMIDDHEIGIAQLDTVFSRVSEMDLENDDEIGHMLLKQVKIYNYIPRSKEQIYMLAIKNEYVRKCDKRTQD